VGYALSVTPTLYYHGPVVEIRPSGGPRISFISNKDPAELVAVMDTFVQVRKWAARLQPKWATRQLALITEAIPAVRSWLRALLRSSRHNPAPGELQPTPQTLASQKYKIGASPK